TGGCGALRRRRRTAARKAGRHRAAQAARRPCHRGRPSETRAGAVRARSRAQAGGSVVNALVGKDAVRQSLASFRSEREADWKAFEALLAVSENRARRTQSEDELLTLPLRYRSALSSLSVARATSLDNALVGYLEALC